MMNLEFFMLLVVIGFVIGVGLVVTIARSLNPSVRYNAPPDFEPGQSSLGGWILLLLLVFLGYFLLQSKCGKEFQEKISELDLGTKTSIQNPDSTEQTNKEKRKLIQIERRPQQTTFEGVNPEQSQIADDSEPPFENDTPENPEGEATNNPPEESQYPHYYLQVGAFFNAITAQHEKEIWADFKGYSTQLGIVPHESPIKFRVLIGPFSSPQQAIGFRNHYKLDGFVQNGKEITLL